MLKSIMDYKSRAQQANNKYSGVIVTNDIRGNGRKKLLLIGKTGAGKSSLCNVFTGHPHDAEIFPVSAAAVSCTQSTQFAETFFNGDKEKPISVIDTIGFDDPSNDTDANIISELVFRLRDHCDHVNLFIIAVNGQHPRLDSSLIGMIRIFEGMFGESFWSQVVLVFTMLPMDEKAVKKRMKARGGKTDEELATEYLATLQNKFPKGKTLKCLLLDSCYEDTDEDEKEAYDSAMERLWDLLDQAPSLPTVRVQKVETESRQLKNKIEEKEKMMKAIEDKNNETKRKLESQLQQNISEIEELRRENTISQQEYHAKLQEANNKTVENMQNLESELAKLREQAITGEAKPKGFFARVGDYIDNLF